MERIYRAFGKRLTLRVDIGAFILQVALNRVEVTRRLT